MGLVEDAKVLGEDVEVQVLARWAREVDSG